MARRGAAWLMCGLLLACGCAGTSSLDEEALAELPPLPFRLAVVGGAFLPPAVRDEPGRVPERGPGFPLLYSRTYPPGVAEPIPFSELVSVLRRARAATTVLVPDLPAQDREAIALGSAAELRWAVEWAEREGVDLLLVLEGLREGPVESQGVTGQWPITTLAWFLVGLGMFIPDHRFESKVRLHASLRDVHSGHELVSNIVLVPGSMELPLVQRSSFLGIIESILVPPTLVGNDVENVLAKVREEGDRRLLLRLLARLKDPETREALLAGLPLRLELEELSGRRVAVRVDSAQEVQTMVVERIDPVSGRRQAWDDRGTEAFVRAFLGSGTRDASTSRLRYRGDLPDVSAGTELRVVVRSVAGERASSTIRITP